MIGKTELTQYRKAVCAALYGPAAYRKRVMKQLEHDISRYLEENPDTSMQELRQFFGEPEAYARESAASEMIPQSNPEIGTNIAKRVMIMVAAALTACVLIWGCCAAYLTVEGSKRDNGYVTYHISAHNNTEDQ